MNSKFQQAYSKIFGDSSAVSLSPVGGGSINYAYKVTAPERTLFVKSNAKSRYPGMFEAEIEGLDLLRKNSDFFIPQTHGVVEVDNHAFLFMEYLDSAVPNEDFWESFGRRLADLHSHSSDSFGLPSQNYIGSLPQDNSSSYSWIEFFANYRLRPLIRMAVDSHALTSSDLIMFESLEKKLEDYFPSEAPSLLHGDLWSGNYMCSADGEPCLIDPAVYYGHRYMDLGMMKLFGGFDQKAMISYAEVFPLEPSWNEGTEVANLYPLLVHLVLFGGGYLGSVRNVLKSFG